MGPFAAGVGCTLTTLVVLALGLFAVRACASRALQGSYLGPKYYDNEHYLRALHYERARQPEAAIKEWKALDADGWREIATRPLAEALARERRFEEALEVIDRNGSNVSWGEYIDLRTHLLEQWKGVDSAVAWLKELDAKDPTSPFWAEQLGVFHLDAGRPREALEPLLESVRRACALHGYRFDDRDELVDYQPAPSSDAEHEARATWHNDIADLWPALQNLATAYEELDDDESAYKWATRDVSMARILNEQKGYLDPDEVEAGSSLGRLVRARVLTRRGELELATTELDRAERTRGDAYYYRNQIALARERIAELRRGKK